MSERVLNQAVYSLIKELEVQTDRRVKGEARCKCKCEHGARYEHGVRCKCKCEARAKGEICLVGCILFVLILICMYR